jgi:beta-ureidopropionase / N-carbamoyl-L-amino-acid hydrolase
MTESLRINQDRLWQAHMYLAKIGALANGGNCRLTLTDEDKLARDLFIDWCRQAGCEVSFDQIGNIFIHRAGKDGNKNAVMCGSHLDTQPHGGKFDGIYGVLAGLEVIRTLNDNNIETELPIEIAVWINEEGVRFSPGVTGSATFAGVYSVEEILAIKSNDGCLWGDELQRTGFAGEEKPGDRELDSFFELHIEQGPVLENQKKQIGVVTGIQGIRWLLVDVIGKDAHAGTTPLDMRKDALVSAAKMVVEANSLGKAYAPEARVTIGQLEVTPNGPSTIPSKVSFTVDIRHPDNALLEQLKNQISKRFEEIAAEENSGLELSLRLTTEPVIFNADCLTAIKNASKTLGYSHMNILSGAGHDSIYLSRVAPTGMIFVPSQGGVSHSEAEYSSPEDLAAGCNVLLHSMLERARAL